MKKIVIYTDGGSRGNPGPSAIGVVFCNEKGSCFKKYSMKLNIRQLFSLCINSGLFLEKSWLKAATLR